MQSHGHGRTMSRREGRAGYTLIHMLAYVAVLAVVINVCAAMFVAMLRMHDAGSTALGQSQHMRHVEADLRDVVREAVAVVPGIGQYVTSEAAVVLAMPPEADSGAARYAVFRRVNGEDGYLLQRLELQVNPEGLDVTYLKTYGLGFSGLEFDWDGAPERARAVTVRITELDDGNPQRDPREGSILAALGGMGGAL